MYFIFDTETNGLPKNYSASAEDFDQWPRITQLCFAGFNEDGDCFLKFNSLIKPDGWEIPKEKFFIDNNMTTERCEREGVSIAEALDCFIKHRLNARYSIGHNISFDSKIIRAEMFRLNRREEFESEKICTMMKSTAYCQLCVPNSNRFKWPKLEELHRFLFKSEFVGAHDAMNDVMATAKCFFELKKRGVIDLNKKKEVKPVYPNL